MRSAAGKRYFRDYGLLVLNAVMFSILMFGTDVFLEFTTDTYRTFAVGVGKKARDMIVRNGRPVIALYYRLFGMTGLKEELFYYISFITGLLLTAGALIVLQLLLEDIFRSRKKAFLTSVLIVTNIFVIEYYMFVETMGFMTGVFFAVLAAVCAARFYGGLGKLWLIPSLCFLLIAQFAYQPAVGIFCAILLPLVSYYADGKPGKFLLNNLVLGCMFGIVNVASIVMMKHFNSYRSAFTVSSTIENIRWAVKTIWEVIRYSYKVMDGILPNGTFMAVTGLLIALTSLKALFCRGSRGLSDIASLLYSIVMVILMQILYYAVGRQHAMRICYPLGALPGVAIMHYCLLDVPRGCQNTGESGRYDRKGSVNAAVGFAACLLIGLFLTGQYLAFQRVIIDRYKCNRADQMYIETIGQSIREYEEKSGKTVKKIGVYYDANVPDTWEEFTSERYSRSRSLNRTWSDIDSMNYYLGRKFKRAEDNERIREKFAQKDWSAFSQDQLDFDGDTLYLCVY